MLCACLGIVLGIALGWGNAVREGGPIETTQVSVWLLAATIAGLGFIRRFFNRRTARQRAVSVGFAALCLLAAARELDAHIWLNPESLRAWGGDGLAAWGVRYRIDWWLGRPDSSGATPPIAARVLWAVAAIGAGLLAARFVPGAIRDIRGAGARGRVFGLSIIATAAFLCLGYLFDDQLGRERVMNKLTSVALEEFAELVGAGCALGGALVWSVGREASTGRGAQG